MTGWRRILLPVDFTLHSVSAADIALSLASRYRAELHVLHVVVPAPALVPAPQMARCAWLPPDDATMAGAWWRLAHFVQAALDNPGVVLAPAVLVGQPAEQIIAYAQAQCVDLIVLGTHATGMLSRVFMGSVSKTILENVSCPVLMVPARGAADDPADSDVESWSAMEERV